MSTQQLLKAKMYMDTRDTAMDDPEEGSVESFDDELDDDDEDEGKPSKLILVGVVLAALTMIGLHSLTMLTFVGPMVIAAGAVSFLVGGSAVAAEVELSKMETFRAVHNKLRKDVHVFAEENQKLVESNDKLELQVFMLKENEQRFKSLAEEQNTNVQQLVQLVAENQTTIDKMKKCIQQDIVESLINAAFEEERNEDGEFSDREIKRLLVRLRGMPAVTINEELLTECIKKDRSVMSLIEIIKHLDIEGEQLGDKIFIIDEQDPALLEQYHE